MDLIGEWKEGLASPSSPGHQGLVGGLRWDSGGAEVDRSCAPERRSFFERAGRGQWWNGAECGRLNLDNAASSEG